MYPKPTYKKQRVKKYKPIFPDKACWVCHSRIGLHKHHIFYGNGHRKLSEQYGLWVYLCQRHHTGDAGIHFNKALDMELKTTAQKEFEQINGEGSFIQIFGRSYL